MKVPYESFHDYCKRSYFDGPEEFRSGWRDLIKRLEPALYEEIQQKEGEQRG